MVNNRSKNIIVLFFSILIFFAFSLKSLANDDLYELNFENDKIGNWTQLLGTTDIRADSNQLVIKNTTTGSNIESGIVSTDSPSRKSGEVLLDFLYEGQQNISVLFRASTTETYKWQAFAYNDNGKWTLGEPGGKWITNIDGPRLESGNNYTLVIKYNDTEISSYLNGTLFYQNDNVVYPNNEKISQWDGKVGLRLFGNRSTLRINSLKSGTVGSFTDTYNNEVGNDPDLIVMRERWKNSVTGNFSENDPLLKDADVKKYIDNLSKTADDVYKSLNKSSDRTTLWERKPSDTNSANITTQFKNIQILAKSYATPGTTLYMDENVLKDIILSIDFMTTDGKYTGEKYFGNWWDWQVGVPQELIPTLFIIYDDVPAEKMKRFTNILSIYLPNPYQQLYGKAQNSEFDLSFIPNFSNSGANRTDQALSCLGIGILSNNSFKINEAVQSIKEVFEIVESGDGFYPDGSFIQHTDIPYNGSYGNVLVKGVGKIFSIVTDTKWQLEEDIVDSFVTNVEKSFIPLIYNGETMSMVNGRSISRSPSINKEGFGSATLYNLLITSQFAKKNSKANLEETSKYWMLKNIPYYLNNTRDFNDLILTKQLLLNDEISGTKKSYIGSHMYGSMDRFVHSNNENSIAISMYSNRISSFEAINQENKRGWHTSDGMVYLYNNDQQFGSEYWPTVDYYRLPGTTVDTIKMDDETSFKSYRSNESHVGGVSDGMNASIAMQLNKNGSLNNGQKTNSNLTAKKSWFVLDNKLINLGTDINGTTDATIETIVENRLLDDNTTYKFVNKNGIDVSNKKQVNISKNDWYLLESNKENTNIGYLMLQDQTVSTERENRSGTYKDINAAFPSDYVYSSEYQKVIINHGNKAENDSYGYITYPNATKSDLEELSSSQQFQILQNTKKIQSVKDTKNDVVAANIWSETGGEIEGILVNKPVSIISSDENNLQTISVSNPKQTPEFIELKLPKKVKSIKTINKSISLNDDKQTVVIDSSNSLGATFTFTVEYEDVSTPVEKIDLLNNSLEIVKKNSSIELKAFVLPSNATERINWRVEKPSIAIIENGKIIGKKAGMTKVIVSSENGIEESFILRVTP